jgi:hypothetical protein
MDSDFANLPDWIKICAVTLSASFFTIFIILEYIALKRIEFKVEKSGTILLYAYTITMT